MGDNTVKKIGFIGAGNMAKAIINGIVRAKMSVSLAAYDVNTEQTDILAETCNVERMPTIEALTEACDCIILAVKPQNVEEVLMQIRPVFQPEQILVSIAAGISQAYLQKMLGFTAKTVRVMPNTPLLLGCGATALAGSPGLSEQEFRQVEALFQASGVTVSMPEDKMNEVIAVNGSAPAFIYAFADAMVQYADRAGLPEGTGLQLFAATLIGSAKMLTESGYSIEELIRMVSSKGGTTIAGLEAMRKNGLTEAITAGCEACTARAYELMK